MEGPGDFELMLYQDVVFTCMAVSDDSTPVEYKWLWEGREVVYQDGRLEQDDDGSLRLITRNDHDGGRSFTGQYTCNATNGYSFALATADLTYSSANNSECYQYILGQIKDICFASVCAPN